MGSAILGIWLPAPRPSHAVLLPPFFVVKKPRPPTMCTSIKQEVLGLGFGDDLWRSASGRLAIGLGRSIGVRPSSLLYQCSPRPLIQPVAFTQFHGEEHAADLLAASCHVPGAGGIWPRRVALDDRHHYWDGSFAADFAHPHAGESFLGDCPVVTVSVRSRCKADIWMGDLALPVLWMLRPPPVEVLALIHGLGYLRAEEYFLTSDVARCALGRPPLPERRVQRPAACGGSGAGGSSAHSQEVAPGHGGPSSLGRGGLGDSPLPAAGEWASGSMVGVEVQAAYADDVADVRGRIAAHVRRIQVARGLPVGDGSRG